MIDLERRNRVNELTLQHMDLRNKMIYHKSFFMASNQVKVVYNNANMLRHLAVVVPFAVQD